MFSLVAFTNSSWRICPSKNVKNTNGTLILKHLGCKYEVSIIASCDSEPKLKEILTNLKKGSQQSGPESTAKNALLNNNETLLKNATVNDPPKSALPQNCDPNIHRPFITKKLVVNLENVIQSTVVDLNLEANQEFQVTPNVTLKNEQTVTELNGKNQQFSDTSSINLYEDSTMEELDANLQSTLLSNSALDSVFTSNILFSDDNFNDNLIGPSHDLNEHQAKQLGIDAMDMLPTGAQVSGSLQESLTNHGFEENDSDYVPQQSSNNSDTLDTQTVNGTLNDSRTQNISNDISALTDCDVSALFDMPGSSACDDAAMHVENSRGRSGDKKYNFCLFCHKKQMKIARHLELMHKEEDDVAKFIVLPKKSLERRKIIEVIRKKGNYLFNTDNNLNDGELIVSRRPNVNRNRLAQDFKACGNCKAYFAKSSLRVHFKNCVGSRYSSKSRIVMVMSKKVEGRIHARATQVVRKELFPPLREDNVVRLIRYDELIINFANKMCEKYKDPRFFEMIRQRMRLLGRFLLAIKKLNTEISDMTSVYDPKFCDDALSAINIEAQLDQSTMSYKVPTVASNLATLLKQVGNILINECIKKHDDDQRKNTKNFLKLFTQDVSVSVTRTVVESQVQQTRRKKVELPSKEDIQMLHSFLNQKRKEAFKKLSNAFSEKVWIELAETTLISIQLFNRRRAGEVERILIDDFNSYQGIDKNTDADMFKTLTQENQEIAKKYVRFAIRGKLNRTVPVLLDTNILECVKLILKHRKKAAVSDKNPYVFGICGNEKLKPQYLRACTLMRKFSTECGAQHPERLRGTKLRKHIATTCISLNLSEHEVTDLANFMGHAEKIHKDIYRQPVMNRDILRMSKLLEAAQGGNDSNDSESENEDDEEFKENLPKINNRRRNVTKTIKKKRSTSPYGTVKRTPWSQLEKETIFNVFKEEVNKKILPSLKDIQRAIIENPCLQNRTSPQVKTWLHNQYKTKQNLRFS